MIGKTARGLGAIVVSGSIGDGQDRRPNGHSRDRTIGRLRSRSVIVGEDHAVVKGPTGNWCVGDRDGAGSATGGDTSTICTGASCLKSVGSRQREIGRIECSKHGGNSP